jgi:hypothetical protein
MVFSGWGRWSRRDTPLPRQVRNTLLTQRHRPKPYFQIAAAWTTLAEGNNFHLCLLEQWVLKGCASVALPDKTLRRPGARARPLQTLNDSTLATAPGAAPSTQALGDPGTLPKTLSEEREEGGNLREGLEQGLVSPAASGTAREPLGEATLAWDTLTVGWEDRLRLAVSHGRVRDAAHLVERVVGQPGVDGVGLLLSDIHAQGLHTTLSRYSLPAYLPASPSFSRLPLLCLSHPMCVCARACACACACMCARMRAGLIQMCLIVSEPACTHVCVTGQLGYT